MMSHKTIIDTVMFIHWDSFRKPAPLGGKINRKSYIYFVPQFRSVVRYLLKFE